MRREIVIEAKVPPEAAEDKKAEETKDSEQSMLHSIQSVLMALLETQPGKRPNDEDKNPHNDEILHDGDAAPASRRRARTL